MAYFAVERKLPGITSEALKGAGLRAKTCADDMVQEGSDVRWLRSFFIPSQEQTFCVFEAPNVNVVRELNERAQIPFNSISEVHELTPETL